MGTDDPTFLMFCPYRARCSGCKVTHVLLPVALAARRADEAAVISAAIEAHVVEGLGHRSIAERLGRPVSTVRGWLRAYVRSAGALGVWFRRLVLRDAPDAVGLWPQAAGGLLAQAVEVLMAYARVFGERFTLPGTGQVPWHVAALARVGPWVFSGTWWTKRTATPIAPDASGC